jgi:methionine synthase I (cobalamin-dependent)
MAPDLIAAARAVADRYADAACARLFIAGHMPAAVGPDRHTIDDVLATARLRTILAHKEYLDSLRVLVVGGDDAIADEIIADVEDRIQATWQRLNGTEAAPREA